MLRVHIMWKISGDSFNAAIISKMEETPDQYWGMGMYGVRYNMNFFYIDLSYCKKNF